MKSIGIIGIVGGIIVLMHCATAGRGFFDIGETYKLSDLFTRGPRSKYTIAKICNYCPRHLFYWYDGGEDLILAKNRCKVLVIDRDDTILVEGSDHEDAIAYEHRNFTLYSELCFGYHYKDRVIIRCRGECAIVKILHVTAIDEEEGVGWWWG